MKRNTLMTVFVVILALALLFCGCSALLENMEDARTRQSTEAILDALIADDFQAAYSQVTHICTEAEFKPVFTQLKGLLGDADSYELKLLSINTNSRLHNGQTSRTVSSVYEMTAQSGRIVVSIQMEDSFGLSSFHLTPYEQTDYYVTGTLETLRQSSAVQWIFLLLNVLPIGLSVLALVDCLRHKFKYKVLLVLLLIFGFVSVGATIASTSFRLNFILGSFTAYSALIRYGSGTVMLRLMLPIGAIAYFLMRRSLLAKNAPPIVPPQVEPEVREDNSIQEEPSSPLQTDDQVNDAN